MWSHIRSLELLLLVATIAPAELVRVATSFRMGEGDRVRAARYATYGVPAAYLTVAGLAVAVAVCAGFTPGCLTAWRAGPPWFAAALVAGFALVGAEFAVGAVPTLLRGVRGIRLAVAGFGAMDPAVLASIGLTAVAEELLYRGVWIGVLHDRLHLPATVAICCAAAGYALGHLFFGGLAVAQKALSGGVFGVLLVVSGSLAVPLVAHLGQNLAVYGLARRAAAR